MQYYSKLPTDLSDRDAIVLDPMLATGHSSSAAIDDGEGGGRAVGDARLHRRRAAGRSSSSTSSHPDVHIVCAAVDRGLDERGFIVPGLGDAGDRLYGTK